MQQPTLEAPSRGIAAQQLERVNRRARVRRRRLRLLRRGILLLALLLTMLTMVFPLIWMLLSSLEPESAVDAYPPVLWPQVWTLRNYHDLFTTTQFGNWLLNSSIASVSTTIAVVALASTGAYALSRFRFPGSELFGRAILASYMLPSILLVIPIALLVTEVGMANNLAALVVVYVSTMLAFGLWLLRSYFLGIALDLEHAAMIDGATRLQAFYLVVLPQAVPGLITTAIFTFNESWSEYLFASILMSAGDKMTLSPGLSTFTSQTGVYYWGILMAAGVLVTLPVVAIFIALQRYLVAGWGGGALKG